MSNLHELVQELNTITSRIDERTILILAAQSKMGEEVDEHGDRITVLETSGRGIGKFVDYGVKFCLAVAVGFVLWKMGLPR